MPDALYDRLMAAGSGRGDPSDRHVFACAIVAGLGEDRSLSEALGLDGLALRRLIKAYFAGAEAALPPLDADASAGEDALEEPDLRALLVESSGRGADEEQQWLAAIVARRSLGANHLWQDLGLADRSELSALLHRRFGPLAARNNADMKWKKFFYRELCRREGVVVCKAPNCAMCDDVALCFGAEDGEPLSRLRKI